MSKDNLSRRLFLKTASILAASGILAWASDKSEAEAEEAPVIGVDSAEEGGDETVLFSTGHLDRKDQPFYPYYVEPSATVFVNWYDMEDGDTWGMPDERED